MSAPTCDLCGSEMRAITEFEPPTPESRQRSAGLEGGVIRLGGVCANPDCPGAESDLAKAAPEQ